MYRFAQRFLVGSILIAAFVLGALLVHKASAQEAGEFSLQVSPSPLIATLKPGQATSLELKIRNAGLQTEHLKISPRAFVIGNDQSIKLDDTKQPEVASWLHYSAPTFAVAAGQIYTQTVTINVPKDAGFSYSFALVVSRTQEAQPDGSTTALRGSVAIFTLLNIDRPGASRQLQVAKFNTSQSVYEYLPAEFDIDFKNTGNTIVQPAGTVFVQRGSNDKDAISTLPVNSGNGYILPGTTRTLKVDWTDGFQVEKTTTANDGSTSKHLEWNWNNIGDIRFGKYTAKLVAIYNDGQRDVPIMAEVSFWVIPWKLLGGALVVLLLVAAGIWSLVSKIIRLGKRIKR